MDVVWLILDSLSATATPFVSGGPDTMPELSRLADEEAVVFSNAYVPGPASPSSHGSMFTGKHPSETGMHEAQPYFDQPDMETIAGALNETHESFIVSCNPFIFNGTHRDFDVVDDLRNQQYLLFDSASDPGRDDERWDYDSTLKEFVSFAVTDGKPIRSILNGVSYKYWVWRQGAGIPKQTAIDDENYQYADEMNARIRDFVDRGSDDSFVVANYMDVHPPFDASDKALEKFAPDYDREELPIGVHGQEIYEEVNAGNAEVGERMQDLYLSTIWDIDRKLTPMIEDFVDDGTFVIVTADHGTWFRRHRELDEDRIHVPLLLFAPGETPRTVTETVNTRSLAHTTMEVASDSSNPFDGYPLLDVTEDQISITEFIHDGVREDPVRPSGEVDGETQRDIAAIRNGARVDYIEGETMVQRGSSEQTQPLVETIEDIRSIDISDRSGGIAYDAETEDRLRDLGYLE